ncbi:MAG: KTSC domain-containing protein [Lachnospiraceae bacterium]|nr:KTSC domain-containing protein [Lachnospiraceae bacterium]
MKHITFFSKTIETIGYDPQTATLEVKLMTDGRVLKYEDVPEEIWYSLRHNYHPDTYFRVYVCGHYEETVVSEDESSKQ